jgi:hypothetical protein
MPAQLQLFSSMPRLRRTQVGDLRQGILEIVAYEAKLAAEGVTLLHGGA